jgi:hypothetical protein
LAVKLATFLAINAIVAGLHSVGFIFLPSVLLAIYGVPATPGSVLMAELFGVQLLFVAVVAWCARGINDARALWAIVLGGVVTSAAGTIIVGKGLADGVFGPMGWLALAIYGLFTLGYLYFQLQPATRAG